MFDKWILEFLFNNENNKRFYIDENVNGDVCLFLGVVYVFCVKGEYKFIYEGKEGFLLELFLFWGICIDVLSNIFVVDENNCGIYVLDKDGCFLIMLIIMGELYVILIFMCIDC